MFDLLDIEQFSKIATDGKRVAIYKEFPADFLTPMGALDALHGQKEDLVLLESVEKDAIVGKYSLIGFELCAEIKAYGKTCHVKSENKREVKEGDPFEELRILKNRYGCISDKELPGFSGGCVGFLAYDAIRYFEKIPDRHARKSKVPDLFFQFYNGSIVFDNAKKNLTIVLVVTIDRDVFEIYREAGEKIDQIYEEIKAPSKRRATAKESTEELEIDLSDEAFKEIVQEAKEYIYAGDAFQIVVSRSFQKKITAEPLDIYRALRMVSPAPYMFYFRHPDFSLLGASPEKLVSLEGSVLETIPIAGTRPRGKNEEEDQLMESELLSDPKEEAEHMMLVDLARNDLGSIAKPGSVCVDQLKRIQRFSHVMHLVSFVKGFIGKEGDAIDALRACFPAGTLSGAPKIRAMEIIDSLENTRRGLYGGAICFIDGKGNLDSCIAIRMAMIENGIATVRAGAGIVYDSIPQKEADETRQKARSVLEAIQLAEEGRI